MAVLKKLVLQLPADDGPQYILYKDGYHRVLRFLRPDRVTEYTGSYIYEGHFAVIKPREREISIEITELTGFLLVPVNPTPPKKSSPRRRA